MARKMIVVGTAAFVIVLSSTMLLSQKKSPAAEPSKSIEFPVNMRQNITAGKTPVGTKVQASLVVATLINGVVIPRDAVLSGEVISSVAKSATERSRLGIRMDSAQWKNGSASIQAYLSAWFYPVEELAAPDLSYEPRDAVQSPKNWNGAGTYPDPNNPASRPFPGPDSSRDASAEPPSPASNTSKHPVLMKGIETTRDSDGTVALTSTRSNIKLDKLTTYVLKTGDVALPN